VRPVAHFASVRAENFWKRVHFTGKFSGDRNATAEPRRKRMSSHTVFGSLNHYAKGGVKLIGAGENPKHYVFSNVFEVASQAKPYEKIAVAQNLKYVIEVLRAEGTSSWYAADHDESALVMDGQIEIHLIKPEQRQVASGIEGAVRLAGTPAGEEMGWVKASRGHMVLLPKGSAYQFRATTTGVILLQTIKGGETVEKWSSICQTAA
jgi:hypothetical protein